MSETVRQVRQAIFEALCPGIRWDIGDEPAYTKAAEAAIRAHEAHKASAVPEEVERIIRKLENECGLERPCNCYLHRAADLLGDAV